MRIGKKPKIRNPKFNRPMSRGGTSNAHAPGARNKDVSKVKGARSKIPLHYFPHYCILVKKFWKEHIFRMEY